MFSHIIRQYKAKHVKKNGSNNKHVMQEHVSNNIQKGFIDNPFSIMFYQK